MRSSIVLPLIAVLALAACKKEGVVAKDESAESVAKKVAASNIRPLPGRWESNMKFEKMEVPNMPADAKAVMDKQMGITQTFASCLTPAEAEKPEAGFFQKGAENCTYDHFVMTGGKLDAAMTCKERNQQIKMTMVGAYSQTSYNIKVNSQGEMGPGMPMSMAMTISSRRVGDCNGSEEK
jgi:hypothetical protein